MKLYKARAVKSLNNTNIQIAKNDLKLFIRDIFTATGLPKEKASTIARHLVLANLRGIDSHGVSRVGIYMKRLEKNQKIPLG
ncbi:hypothetical protein CHH51_11905 [Terribacillus saccharophilus]|nr:hypothetical protein CHH51_11905 [Terribacillus saccharophilus]